MTHCVRSLILAWTPSPAGSWCPGCRLQGTCSRIESRVRARCTRPGRSTAPPSLLAGQSSRSLQRQTHQQALDINRVDKENSDLFTNSDHFDDELYCEFLDNVTEGIREFLTIPLNIFKKHSSGFYWISLA